MNPQPIPLAEVLAATAAEIRGELSPETVFRWVERDSRSLWPGDLFLAVRGEVYDGHDFVGQAAERGATAAMVSRQWADANTDVSLPLLVVAEPVAALQQLATALRQLLP